jgi:uncharacterized protein
VQAVPFRLHPGDDLKTRLDRLAWEQGWRAACILTCVGSLSRATLRFADSSKLTEVKGPLEIVSLAGTIASFGGSHLHISVADRNGTVVGGHVKEGCIIRTTAEIVLATLDGYAFHREIDPDTGFPELVVGPA